LHPEDVDLEMTIIIITVYYYYYHHHHYYYFINKVLKMVGGVVQNGQNATSLIAEHQQPRHGSEKTDQELPPISADRLPRRKGHTLFYYLYYYYVYNFVILILI
jgi:hypothetical protein